MDKIVEKMKCNGCEACKVICPKNAISMIRDEEGFFYPDIDEALCIDCGLCGKKCPVQMDAPVRKIDYKDSKAYGGYCTDKEALLKSTSGGFCVALAQNVCYNDGIVYGAVFSDDFRMVSYTSTQIVSFHKMRGSKYVTAKKDDIYKDVKVKLEANKKAVFIGLPCEIAALYSFLGHDYENLITVELICAGASSYNLLDEQLDWAKNRYREEIKNFSFRFKKYGWVPCSIKIDTLNYSYSKILSDTIFGIGMKYAKRKACFNCQIKGDFRVADFTVGDFWNINKRANYYNENGTSVVFCRTKKAESILKGLDNFYYEAVSAEDAISGNRQQLNYAEGIPENRELYFKVLREQGGEAAYRQFKPKQSMTQIIKNKLPVPVYRWLRSVEAKIRG